VAAVKTSEGPEKKVFEIEVNSIEKIGGSSAAAPKSGAKSKKFATEEIVKFESDDFGDELIGEDEIPF
jgi:hypothetical protein